MCFFITNRRLFPPRSAQKDPMQVQLFKSPTDLSLCIFKSVCFRIYFFKCKYNLKSKDSI